MGALIVDKLVEPISKFIDVFSRAIGKIYEPTHIRRMARAKGQEIVTVAEAIRENMDVPIVIINQMMFLLILQVMKS
jgi:hypothetical protein